MFWAGAVLIFVALTLFVAIGKTYAEGWGRRDFLPNLGLSALIVGGILLTIAAIVLGTMLMTGYVPSA